MLSVLVVEDERRDDPGGEEPRREIQTRVSENLPFQPVQVSDLPLCNFI
jgi:hypothetical protein